MNATNIESLKIKAFLTSIVEELLFESKARENFYFLFLLEDFHEFVSQVGTTDVVLNDALLKGEAIMHWSSNSLFKT
jgi:hypothetical protein